MKEKLFESFQHLLDSVIATAPKVMVGLLLVVAGILVAKVIEIVLRAVLTRARC